MDLLAKRVVQSLLIAFISISVTYTLIWSYRFESILMASLGTLSAWSGVLAAHYIETGHLADEAKSHSEEAETMHTALFPGLALMVLAFPIAILGVHMDSVIVIFAGELSFFSGFAIGHYGLTGKCF